MNPLQRCKVHTSLQFGRLRSNRFGENGLTGACGAVFPKQAAPKSLAFLSCHGPLPPGTRCGELRGGLSSRVPGAESLKHSLPRRVGLPGPKSARSTEFPLRRLAVRGCERTMSRATRRASMKRSGTSEADFRTAATNRVVRWFLLLEGELVGGWKQPNYKSGWTAKAGAADYKSAAS